jgi:hypothetical protein
MRAMRVQSGPCNVMAPCGALGGSRSRMEPVSSTSKPANTGIAWSRRARWSVRRGPAARGSSRALPSGESMDLVFGIMRSHFHDGYRRGVHCCVQCTLAVIPVLEAGAIRYFDCRELSIAVRRLVGNASGGLPNRPTRDSCAGHWVTRRCNPSLTTGCT